MDGKIKVDFDKMTGSIGAVRSIREGVTQAHSDLDVKMRELLKSWTGAAADAFTDLYDAWSQDTLSLISSIEDAEIGLKKVLAVQTEVHSEVNKLWGA